MTDSRERRMESLLEATGENTKSKAIDQATTHFIKLAGGTTAVPAGRVEQLMERAVDQGSVTPEEIAEILDTNELPVTADVSWSVGDP